MLHRITLRMYDDNPLDATILDSLAGMDHRRRQEFIRTFIRVGYNQIMAGASANSLESLNGLESLQSILNVGRSSPKKEPPARTPVNVSDQKEQVKVTVQGTKTALTVDEDQVGGGSKDDILLGAAPVIDEEEEGDMLNPLGKMARKVSEADQ